MDFLFLLVFPVIVLANSINDIFDFTDCFIAPDECPNSNLSFWLYTEETIDNPKKLDSNNLRTADFQPKRKFVVLIHGYTGHRDYSPNTQIRPALLENEDVFVLSLDYGPLVKEPCYVAATRNLDMVGRCTAEFLDKLIQNNLISLEDIHIIGFSLGAQVAGIIGYHMKSGQLNWITGLDPAKPLFVFKDKSQKLDKNDAKFVDIMHTDILMRGMLQTMGHVDFYVNGGMEQPGCATQNVMSKGSCNHDRAAEYYAESIFSTKGFYGFKCPSWLEYAFGFCLWTTTNDTMLMGYRVHKSAEGVYFVQTNSKPPYARGPYPEAASNVLTLNNGETIEKGILFGSNSTEADLYETEN